MVNKQDIKDASDVIELDLIVSQAAYERNCEIDGNISYSEQSDFFLDESLKERSESMKELSDILSAAQIKLEELESEV